MDFPSSFLQTAVRTEDGKGVKGCVGAPFAAGELAGRLPGEGPAAVGLLAANEFSQIGSPAPWR